MKVQPNILSVVNSSRIASMLLVAFALPLLPACSGGKADSSAKPAAPAVPVTVAVTVQKDVPVQLNAIGNVKPFSTVAVKVRVDGQLAKVGFKQGDEVKKGDLIFTIDPRPFQASLNQAEAELARDVASMQNAEADMKRTDELANTKAVAATVVDQNRSKVASLRATVEADKAAIDTAKLQLEYCFIHSPVDGRIGVLMVNEGNVVKNNDTVLAVINQIKPVYVDFHVPEQSLQEVRDAAAKAKLKVEATLPQYENQHTDGTLEVINNEVDITTGSVLLRASFPNQDELLWPGRFVNVTLMLRMEKNVVVVPSSAIQPSQQGTVVFVVKKDDTVEMRPVVSGSTIGPETVVEKGLEPQERVVTSGQLRLIPGTKVEVKTSDVVGDDKS